MVAVESWKGGTRIGGEAGDVGIAGGVDSNSSDPYLGFDSEIGAIFDVGSWGYNQRAENGEEAIASASAVRGLERAGGDGEIG